MEECDGSKEFMLKVSICRNLARLDSSRHEMALSGSKLGKSLYADAHKEPPAQTARVRCIERMADLNGSGNFESYNFGTNKNTLQATRRQILWRWCRLLLLPTPWRGLLPGTSHCLFG